MAAVAMPNEPYCAAASRLREVAAACSRSITARQPGLTCDLFRTMQAVMRGMSGISLEQSRIASPEHICCASDEKAKLGDVWSAKAVAATAKSEAVVFNEAVVFTSEAMVWWRVMKNASPSSVD